MSTLLKPGPLPDLSRRGLIGAAALLGTPAILPVCELLFAAEPKKGGVLRDRHRRRGLAGRASIPRPADTATYMQYVLPRQLPRRARLPPSWCGTGRDLGAEQGRDQLGRQDPEGHPFPHNGKEMTAEDVVAPHNPHHRGENSKWAAKVYLQQVFGDIKATRKYEGHLHAAVWAGLHRALYNPAATTPSPIMPAEAVPDSAIGTGAFIKEAFEPGVRYLGKRNPQLWKQGRGWADWVEQLAGQLLRRHGPTRSRPARSTSSTGSTRRRSGS